MKTIANKYGGRDEVELEGNEPNIDRYASELLNEGWDMETALKYACRRFGQVTVAFRNWWLG